MTVLAPLSALWKDPPPAFVFELSEAGIAMARTGRNPESNFFPLPAGVISVSPLRDNILLPEELARAVSHIAPQNGGRKRRDATLILPDACARVSVLDFDDFPSDAKEQLSLVRFRMKKSVPYDVESALLSYYSQPPDKTGKKFDVVVAVVPMEIVLRYEAPFRLAAIEPGMVTTSALAALELVDQKGTVVVAKLSGRILTILVLQDGVLKLIRSLELTEPGIAEAATDLHPTFVYIEDNLGAKAEKLVLAGFGPFAIDAREQFGRELGLPVEVVHASAGVAGDNSLGLAGYLQSLER